MKIISIHKKQTDRIALLIAGNRLAQKQLFEELSPKMLSVCRMYVKNFHDAEDVMLTGFAKVFKNITQYAATGTLEGWVRQIMIYESLSFLRAKKQIIFTDDIFLTEDVSDQINDNADDEELQFYIDQLPEGCKTVFILYVVEGLKHREIADILEISEGTSKSQLAHARKWLQTRLKKQYKTSDNGVV